MKITHEFEVARPADTVWAFFQDVPSVAQCLPGAELTEVKDGGVYAGAISVKLGPMTATFEGEATVTVDADTRAGTIDGKGVDRRGGSRGKVVVDYRLEDRGASTAVAIDADVTLSGSAAQFGRTGLVNEMSLRLINEFVACVEGKLAAETEEAAQAISAGQVGGLRLFFQSLLSWLRRLFGRREG